MYNSIRGRLRLGTNGYSGRYFPGQDYLTKADNVVYEDNILRTIGGVAKYDTSQVSGGPSGYGAIAWEAVEDRPKIVTVWSNGKVYLESSGTIAGTELQDYATTLIGPASLFTAGEESSGENKKLFVLAPEQAPFYLDGESTTTSSLTASADWSGVNQPSAGTLHDSRVVLWGNRNFPHNVYFSKIDDHTTFTGANTFTAQITPGFGKEIRACVSFIQNRLYVFKDEGVFHIDTTSIATASYLPVTTYSQTIGIAGPKAWANVGGDLWFLDQNGMLRSLVAVDASNDLRDSNLFVELNMQNWVRQYMNRQKLQFAELNYDEEQGVLYISVPGKTSTHNNTRIIVNLQDKRNPKVSFDTERGDFFQSGFFYKESGGVNRLYYAGGTGYVYRTDLSDRLADGSSYTATFRTSQEDFRFLEPILQQPMADKEKRFDSLMLSMIGTTNSTISVQPYIDGVAYGSAFTISLADSDENMILTNNSPFDLTDSLLTSDAEDISRIDHLQRIGGRGRYLSLEFSSTSEFRILEAYVNFAIQGIKGIG